MKFMALQTINITVNNRSIHAIKGECYELTEWEIKKIPEGYFTPVKAIVETEENAEEEKFPARRKEKGGRF